MAAAGCGSPAAVAETPPSGTGTAPVAVVGERNLVAEAYGGRFRALATVLESPGHGPQLCSTVAESLPPQCGGPDVLGWDWATVPAESVRGTTWGDYELVGTFSDGAFTLTEPAVVADPRAGQDGPVDDDPFATPCAPPAGGWAPPDPARATDEDLQAAQEVATATPGHAGLWIDQRMPAGEPITEENGNDPARIVLNASTAGDVAALDAALREVWGGSLCVSSAARSEADLLAVS